MQKTKSQHSQMSNASDGGGKLAVITPHDGSQTKTSHDGILYSTDSILSELSKYTQQSKMKSNLSAEN